ncbi:MAG TPA: GNAT family N-acetyltransferase [Anaerolineales bacterium]|nr:GNAT family N-acetyltransferase [Anaerolineales bacterium]
MFSNIHHIEPSAWDQLSDGRPFQSHRWYAFGERVMADCLPVYLLAYADNKLIGRACLWLVRNEPLPLKLPAVLMKLVLASINRWPLLICRSPMANASGLILPDDTRREPVLSALANAALASGKQLGVSIVLFDYLDVSNVQSWPPGFVTAKLPSSGTVMENRWKSMEEYLADGNKKDRQHYKRILREAEKLGIKLKQRRNVPDLDAALKLIRNVERRHSSPPNPWIRNLLENMESVNGTWLEARIGTRLVGCGLILEDNSAQMTTALGLEEGTTYAYFLLIYASLEDAFEKHLRLLRWGTGAYEVKERLGFKLEQDNFVTVCGTNHLTNLISRLASL